MCLEFMSGAQELFTSRYAKDSLWDRSVQRKFLEEKASELVLRERHNFLMCRWVRGDVEGSPG